MADRATYILMGAYIVLFFGLFVCVFGAIIFLVREQTASERPVATVEDRRISLRTAAAMSDGGTSGAPAVAAPPVQLIPTS